MLVSVKDIKVKNRVRKDLGNLEDLKDSLRRYGLLNPITLNSKYELIAGERRQELLAHELCHIARIALDSTLYEETFAYQVSPSPLRRLWDAIKEFFAWLFKTILSWFK